MPRSGDLNDLQKIDSLHWIAAVDNELIVLKIDPNANASLVSQ